MSHYILPESITKEIDVAITKYPPGKQRSAIKAALRLVQDFNQGWLTPALMDAVAAYLDLPVIAVYEVATFYSLYDLAPVGKYKISLCTNVSCYLRGCERLAQHLFEKLNIHFNETTDDKKFTLKEVECIAACSQAPAMQINGTYYGNLTIETLDALLAKLE
jgi:NADH-quinone oxidoreductase subunit E